MNIELESLVGDHELSGAFFDMVSEKPYEHAGRTVECQVLRFRLDGKDYEAIENPDDGYRNELKEVRESETAPQLLFAPIKVSGAMKTAGAYGGKDCILQFISARSGKPVLEIGTADIDDYYPGFVAIFAPDNA